MGRTVPPFRIVISEEKAEWKPFRNALDKSEIKSFDDMWDITRLYVSACFNSVQLVPLQPIMISILFHHYKELKDCLSEVEQIKKGKGGEQEVEATNKVNNKIQSTIFFDSEIKLESKSSSSTSSKLRIWTVGFREIDAFFEQDRK